MQRSTKIVLAIVFAALALFVVAGNDSAARIKYGLVDGVFGTGNRIDAAIQAVQQEMAASAAQQKAASDKDIEKLRSQVAELNKKIAALRRQAKPAASASPPPCCTNAPPCCAAEVMLCVKRPTT